MEINPELFKIYTSYLPYKVNVHFSRLFYPKSSSVDILSLEMIQTWHDQSQWDDRYEIKPILYSLDDIDREININDKKIIVSKKIGMTKTDVLALKAYGADSGRLTHSQYKELIKLHFNVFQLEEVKEYIKRLV